MDSVVLVRQILQNWLVNIQGLQIVPLNDGEGLSGTRMWRITGPQHDCCLRQWPSSMDWERILQIHALQASIAVHSAALAPRLCRLRDGSTALVREEQIWELAEWRLGEVVPLTKATAEQGFAAMQSLAEFHRLARQFSMRSGESDCRPAPGLQQRAERVEALWRGELAQALGALERVGDQTARLLLRKAAAIVQAELPSMRRLLVQPQHAALPVQWCHGDARWENFLFEGNRLTGLIDFGASDVDTVVRDVARLRGDLMRLGTCDPCRLLAAYTAIRRLSDHELAALHLFEQSAIPLAIANWLVWLTRPNDPLLSDGRRRSAGLARLDALVQYFAH